MKKTSRKLATNPEHWHAESDISIQERKELMRIANEAMLMRRFPVQDDKPLQIEQTEIIFSDASLTCFGYVAIHNRKVLVGSKTFTKTEKPIHLLESAAVQFAIANLDLPPTRDALFLIDNQIVVNSLKKGSSPMPPINHMIRKLVDRAGQTWIAWIPSAANWADEPSRGKELRDIRPVPLPARASRKESSSILS